MTKLKTLKDLTYEEELPNYGIVNELVDAKKLRAEAIKIYNSNLLPLADKHTGESKYFCLTGENEFIKRFFNLTEEDLK